MGFRLVRVLCLLALMAALPTGLARAHGGGTPRLTNAEAGSYWVSAWTQPAPLRVGQAHITVAVSLPSQAASARGEAGPPVLNAAVEVTFEPLDHVGEKLIVQATHEGAANKLFYEADLELPETGRWRVTVAVAGPDGTGSAAFEVGVSPPSAFSWTWIGGLGLAALAAVWMVQRFRDGRRDTDEHR